MEGSEIIGIGAEAKLYTFKMFDVETVVKERLPKKYRAAALDLKIRKTRTKTEARIMFRLSRAGVRCPRIVALGRFSVYMEKVDGTLLKDKRITDREIAESAKILSRMHSLNVIHGDFTPANLISDGSTVYVIDFGLSEITQSDEEKAIDLLLMKRSIKADLYRIFEKEYAKSYSESKRILNRLKEVERRGRYQVRTLI